MPHNINIREADLNDLPAIDSFDVFAGDRKPGIESGETIVAVLDNVVIGYLVHNKKFFQRPFIWYLCVRPQSQRLGAAGLLFNFAEDFYKNEPLLFSSTEADNFKMLQFFAKHGYTKSGSIDNLQAQAEVVFVKKLQNAVQ